MQKSPRRSALIAAALSLALAGGVFAGQNENVTFALVGDSSVSGVGPDQTVSLGVSMEGLTGVKRWRPFSRFPTPPTSSWARCAWRSAEPSTTFRPLMTPAQLEPGTDNQIRLAVAVTRGDQVDGSATMTLSVKTSDAFTAETQASVSVALVFIRSSLTDLTDRDEFDAAALGLVRGDQSARRPRSPTRPSRRRRRPT